MTQNITTYYIPQNPNIASGKIYNIYLNKVTNLDLSSIMPAKITLNGMLAPNQQIISQQQTSPQSPKPTDDYIISKEDYQKIIDILTETTKLYSQSQDLTQKLTKGRTH